MADPQIVWDLGTGYDFFNSLYVLHRPDEFGLRGAWAAGVRSRLPAEARETLQAVQLFCYAVYGWVHSLPSPKDGPVLLTALAALPPEKRLPALFLQGRDAPQRAEILEPVAERGRWEETDRKALLATYASFDDQRLIRKEIDAILDWWTDLAGAGDRYLQALRSYYSVFFAEEEARIKATLSNALATSQALAEQRGPAELLEDLSHGVQFSTEWSAARWIMAPSFWITPFIDDFPLDDDEILFVYGARPADQSLVPGEVVPDALSRALKALANATRLRILRYLTEQPMTPAQLSRRLRLRVPTVVHHLHALRLASLVHIILEADGGRRYAARAEGLGSTWQALESFVEGKSPPDVIPPD